MKSVRIGPTLILALTIQTGCGGDNPPVTPTAAASLAFVSQPTEALEKIPLAPVRVQALDAAGKPATAPVDITIEVIARGAAVPFAGTKNLTTRNGVASFTDLGIETPGRGFTLVARAPGLPAVTSQAFDVFIRFKQVSSGGTTTCGLTYDNVTWCWGDNSLSRLGVGDDVSRSAPARLLGNFRFDTITVGGIQQCGRVASNDVFCWGGRHPTPTPVAGYKFTWVSSGSGSCGIATNGSLQCWNGPEGAAVITPTLRGAGPYRIGATDLYICAIAPDQQAYCMGGNERGELGFTGPGADKFTQPVSNVRLTNISPAIHHACGLDAGGIAWCWGDNRYGQLGAGSTAEFSATPLRVGAASNLRFRSVSTGSLHTCGLATDGTGWCWGWGDDAELGNGGTGRTNVPVRVTAPVPFVVLSTGGYHACGIGTNGFTYCWGENLNGEVGDGTTTNRSTPQRVLAPPS